MSLAPAPFRFSVPDYEKMIARGILTENHHVELIRGVIVKKISFGEYAPAPFRFSVEDYDRMIERGILTENDRVELIRGEIVKKMSIGERHIRSVNRLTRFFGRNASDQAILSIQNPVVLTDSEPEIDVALLKLPEDEDSSGKPRAADVLLAIEVSDSSLEYDRSVKRALYAEAGIGEYWIVNLIDDCLEVHRDPRPDGTYRSVQTLKRGQETDVLALPGLTVAIADIL